MITEEELLRKNIGYTERDGLIYFYIEEIRKAFPYTKFPQDRIMVLSVNSFLKNTILASDIQEMTDFDKKILQTLNFDPQKK